MNHSTFKALILSVLLSSMPLLANAAPYGDAAVIGDVVFPACQPKTVLSLPFSVSVSSRIFASATVAYENTNGLGTFFVRITDDSGSSVLGVTANVVGMGASLTAQSVVLNGTTSPAPNATAIALLPGNYKAEIRGQKGGQCAFSGHISSGVLSILVLSSVADRIYADGFS